MIDVLIVLPAPSPPAGGNWVFSHRLRRHLEPLGIRVRIIDLNEVTPEEIEKADIVHAFNASRTAAPLIERFGRPNRPFVVTFTGTDVNEEIRRPEEQERILKTAGQADALIFLTSTAMEEFALRHPALRDRCVHIPLGIEVPPGSGLDRSHWGWEAGNLVFFLPAGLRPVKRPLDALGPLERLHEEHPEVRFCIAGAVFDPGILTRVEEAAAAKPWFRWLGQVPHEQMGDLYRAADVVLNTSSSEGLSHALLEAMASGRAVLASAVPGNIDLIREGEDGLLYRDAEDFLRQARRLAENPELRKSLGIRAAARIAEEFSPTEEQKRYAGLYRDLAAAPCGSGDQRRSNTHT